MTLAHVEWLNEETKNEVKKKWKSYEHTCEELGAFFEQRLGWISDGAVSGKDIYKPDETIQMV